MKFDWNDLAMALLGAIFVVFGANLLSEVLYHSDLPETAGYEIEGGALEVAAVAEEEVIVDASMMMADMDPAEGQNVAKKCVSCHNFGEGEPNKVGPHLWDVVNREIAHDPDFGYSGALKTYGEGKVWSFAELNGFLYRPKDHVPGTSMGFNGIRNDEERAEILAYLRTLSNNPAPMPDPAAATPAAAEGEAVEGTPAAGEEAAPTEDAGSGVEPAETNEAGDATTDAVETPVQPEAATSEPVDPAVLAPEVENGMKETIAPENTDGGATGEPTPAVEPVVEPTVDGAASSTAPENAPANANGVTPTTTTTTTDGTTTTITVPVTEPLVKPAD